MKRDYAIHYRELYEGHWWWRAREAFIMDAVNRWHSTRGGGWILDIGCGDGLLFDALDRYGPVEGIDIDATGLAMDGKWGDRIRVQAFNDEFQPERRYALVLLLDVLEHVVESEAFLRRALALLEHGGAAVVTVPAFNILWTRHDEINEHVTRFTRSTFEDLAVRAGARVESCQYFFHWLAPVKLAVRMKEAVHSAPPRSPRIPPLWLNSGLERLCRLEQRALSRFRIPFGSSLLAVLTLPENGLGKV